MKHIFIINPAAGRGEGEKWMSKIAKTATLLDVPVEIYRTIDKQDATRRVKELCNAYKGEVLRFYACGGDGTINEVVNGMIGHKKAEVACIPIGSGNDFVRNFSFSGDFLDIESQILGKSIKVDLIKYSGIVNGHETSKYGVNMFNIGFDANVADDMVKYKHLNSINGSVPYYLSIVHNLVLKNGANIKIIRDGNVIHDGRLLLACICNGAYLGGGIKGAPLANVEDGYFNVNVINNVSRTKFIKLLPTYVKGTHMSQKGIEHIITHFQDKKISIIGNEKEFKFCIDGEINIATGQIDFEIAEKAIKFVLPTKKEL